MRGNFTAVASSCALDVLEMLPVDVLEANIWEPLARCSLDDEPDRVENEDEDASQADDDEDPHPHHPCGSFKLACRQSRRLADLLTTSATCDFNTLEMEFLNTAAATPEAQEAHRRCVLRQHAAFLSRLPRLTHLHLWGWSQELDLSRMLWQSGAATGSRLTSLQLSGGGLSLESMRAVRHACPGLRELRLGSVPTDGAQGEGGGGGGGGGRIAGSLRLDGPLFLPLHGGSLTKLLMAPGLYLAGWPFSNLASLTSLHHLHIHLQPNRLGECVHALAGLVNLRHCDVASDGSSNRWRPPTVTLPDVAALFLATNLTTLRLRRVRHVPPGRPLSLVADDGLHGVAADVPVAEAEAALSRLGGMHLLRCLDLGRHFMVDDAAWDALRRLTLLTELHVGAVATDAVTPGHLPLLQSLGLTERCWRPADLLRSLEPLLPLPSLTALHLGSPSLLLDVSHPGGGSASDEEAARHWLEGMEDVMEGPLSRPLDAAGRRDAAAHARAALHALAEALAAAPRLRLADRLNLRAAGGGLSLAQAAACLAPLHGRFTALRLDNMELRGAEWGALHALLPGLRELELPIGNKYSGGDLVAAVHHLPSLQRLAFFNFLFEDDAAVWGDLATECGRPLRLEVAPWMTGALVERCWAVQEAVHGVQHITWAHAAGHV